MKEFCDYIFTHRISVKEARDIKREIHDYCAEHNVTREERDILAQSGAGEILEMISSMEEI